MTTITQERAALDKVGGPRLRRREQWGARHNYTNSRPVDKPASRIFVHITITNPGNYASNDAHARGVEAIGRARFPATGISYNRGVMPNAQAFEFQPMGRRGAHTVNDKRAATCTTSGCPGRGGPLTASSWNLNINSRAYVICQNVQHTVSNAMVDSLARIIAADILAGLVRSDARIHGHRCVAAKDCPGGRMWARMAELERLVRQYVKNGFGGQAPAPPEEDDDMTPAEREALAKRAGEWAAHLMWQTPLTSQVDQKQYPAQNFLRAIHKQTDWAGLRTGIEGIVNRLVPGLLVKHILGYKNAAIESRELYTVVRTGARDAAVSRALTEQMATKGSALTAAEVQATTARVEALFPEAPAETE